VSLFTTLSVLLFTLFCVFLSCVGIYANHRRTSGKERAMVLSLARGIFGDEAKLARWLNKPLRRFGGRSPVQMMRGSKTDLKKVEQLLIELQEGYF